MLKKKIAAALTVCFLLALPIIGFSQSPAPANGNGQGVDDPLEPVGVPFDDTINLLFLSIGLSFAAVVNIKQWRKKSVE